MTNFYRRRHAENRTQVRDCGSFVAFCDIDTLARAPAVVKSSRTACSRYHKSSAGRLLQEGFMLSSLVTLRPTANSQALHGSPTQNALTAFQRAQTSNCVCRRRCCPPVTASTNGSRQQPSGAKLNGTSANGSSSNQVGQAPAPKAPGEAPPKAKRPAKTKEFNNINRFIVPEDKTEEFEATWRERETNMQQLPGFLGFDLDKQQESEYTVTSKWASIPEWEVYSLSETARRTHLPWGVYQYVPGKGEGFPEDFIPFKQMDAMVNAKY